jgi:hypothetical protein
MSSRTAMRRRLSKNFTFSINVPKEDGEDLCASQYDDSEGISDEPKAKAEGDTQLLPLQATSRICQTINMKYTLAEEKASVPQERERVDLDETLLDEMVKL